MGDSAEAKRARKEKGRQFTRELRINSILNEEGSYLPESMLISMMSTNELLRDQRCDDDNPCVFPVDSRDLEKMIKEILRWRRGLLTRHEIKRAFSR